MSEQKMSYEEVMESWAEAYKYCIKLKLSWNTIKKYFYVFEFNVSRGTY